LSAEEAENFQQEADAFYDLWIETTHREGIINYIHMVGAGHFLYYIKQHKNL